MAKICPKCGREYEGDSCPYCEKPAIFDNSGEYEQRRAAYEKAQQRGAGRRQARRQDAKRAAQRKAAAGKRRTRNADARLIKVRAITGRLVRTLLTILGVLAAFFKRQKKRIIAAAAAFVLLLLCVSIGSQVYAEGHTYLYSYADGVTSRLEKEALTEISGGQVSVWNEAGKVFFTDLPADFESAPLQSSVASQNGKYFAAVYYMGGKMVVIRFAAGQPDAYEQLAAEPGAVELAGLDDSGTLFFLTTGSTADNWQYSESGYTAYFASSGASPVRIGVELTDFHADPTSSRALYLKDGKLHSFAQAGKGAVRDDILDENASDLQVESVESSGVYTNASGASWNSRSDFIYKSGSTYYTGNGQKRTQIWDSDQSMLFVSRKGKPVLGISSSGIWQKQSGMVIRTAGLSADSTYVWNEEKGTLFFVNEVGEICLIKGNKMNVLTGDFASPKLSQVEGSDDVAFSSGGHVGLIDHKGAATELTGVSSADQIVSFKGTVYAVGENGSLLSFGKNGKAEGSAEGSQDYGTSERIWIQR